MLPSTSLQWTLLGFSRPTLLAFATGWPGHLGQVISFLWYNVVALWELCRFYTTGDRNRIFCSVTCKFYGKQLKSPTITPKKRTSPFPARNSCFLLWTEVHTQDSTEAIEYKAFKSLLHCDWFLSLKYIFRSLLRYLSCICNQTGEPICSSVYENTTETNFSEMEYAGSSTEGWKLYCLYHNPPQKSPRIKQISRLFLLYNIPETVPTNQWGKGEKAGRTSRKSHSPLWTYLRTVSHTQLPGGNCPPAPCPVAGA